MLRRISLYAVESKKKSLMDINIKDRLIVITGASSGIGRQCSIACSNAGATVAIFGRDISRLNETLSMMKEPEKHFVGTTDLIDYKKNEEMIEEVVKQKGKISGVVNCAGISTTLPLNSISAEKMEQFFKVNVIGAINLSKHAIKQVHFSDDGGSLVFISSVMGVVGENGKTLYSMTKGALISAVRSMSIELAHRKIRVNSVSPGVVETPMSKNAIYSRNEESLEKLRNMHPLGFGKPEDVANACVFLLSDASRWITGTNLIVDGGYLAK